jgi:hypothetical protein
MPAEVDDVGLMMEQVTLQVGHTNRPLLLEHELVPKINKPKPLLYLPRLLAQS